MRTILCAALLAGGAAIALAGDEIDQLAARLKPEPRFGDYRADFRTETRVFRFHHARGRVEEKAWQVVRDGEKYVALVRSGDIILLARSPAMAATTLEMPTGRYHLDTMQGPSLPTWQFIQRTQAHGAIYETLGEEALARDAWEGGGPTITLVRRQKLPDREVHHRFTFSVDPVFGYRVDGRYQALFEQLPSGKNAGFASGAFTPGCYTPWPDTAIFDRTVYTPAHTTEWVGYANNLLAMDRCDARKDRFTWRDKGFIAYLDPRSGWSVVRTRDDGLGVPRMALCNAHNDFHIRIPFPDPFPRNADGKYELNALHRLMALPPELTRHIWENMTMQDVGRDGVFVRIGVRETFEDQPIPLNLPTRGLTWTSGGPSVSTEHARSGTKSLLLTKTSWPNLPQVSLQPNTAYRLEAWFRVEGDETTRAYIKGDFYEWSPHSRQWLLEQQTTAVGAGAGWQRAHLEFTTPEWDPFINIVFVLEGNGRAWMDDFLLAPVDAGNAPTADGR